MIDRHLPPMTPRNERSPFEFAVRFEGPAATASVLERLIRTLVDLSRYWKGNVVVWLEPDGDSVRSGRWLRIEIDHGVFWAELNASADRFDGDIPERIRAALAADGWVPIDTGSQLTLFPDGDPYYRPVRLVGQIDVDDPDEWCRRLVDSVDLVMEPPTGRWFATAEVTAQANGPLDLIDVPFDPELGEAWTLDLRALLGPRACSPAVWPVGSDSARSVCRLGLHERHEGPCTD